MGCHRANIDTESRFRFYCFFSCPGERGREKWRWFEFRFLREGNLSKIEIIRAIYFERRNFEEIQLIKFFGNSTKYRTSRIFFKLKWSIFFFFFFFKELSMDRFIKESEWKSILIRVKEYLYNCNCSILISKKDLFVNIIQIFRENFNTFKKSC